MNLQNIKKIIQWVIKKIKQIKIGFHLELKIQKIKKQIFFPTLHISGSKSRINVSLAFKNGVQNEIPSDGKKGDLYLKARGYDYSGKAVNFDEKIVGAGHSSGGGDLRWQLKRFQSGTTQLGELSGADEGNYGDDSINCNRKDVFEITEPNTGSTEDWEKPVTDIPYYLVDTDKAIRREIFEMKGI